MSLSQNTDHWLRQEPSLVLVGGPSGIGKTTVINTLVETYPELFRRVRSFTSRPQRADEGTNEYVFLSENQMLEMHHSGKFLNFDNVYGNYYGMEKSDLHECLTHGFHAIKEVHPANHRLPSFEGRLISALLISAKSTSFRFRREEDEEYYRTVKEDAFDVVVHRAVEDPKQAALRLHEGIRNAAIGACVFPTPSCIDAQNIIGYGLVAPEFTESTRITTAGFHRASRPFFQRVLNLEISKPSRTLEVGPGSGWLRQNFTLPDSEYHSIELSSEMKSSDDQRREVCSIRNTRCPNGSFDFVVGSLVDPLIYPATLHAVSRLLKPTGKFIFTLPAFEWASAIRGNSQQKTQFRLKSGAVAEVYSFTLPPERLKALLASSGFQTLSYEQVSCAEALENNSLPAAFQEALEKTGKSIHALQVLDCIIAGKSL